MTANLEGSDPLSPSSLAAVPEVQRWYSELLRWANHPEAESQILRRGVCARELESLLLAVRDATLKAERERLLALTPEEVLNVSAQRLYEAIEYGMKVDSKPHLVAGIQSILPVLLAPEVAKREQAERTMAELARKTNVAEMAREQAEREVGRMEQSVAQEKAHIAAAEAEATRLLAALEAAEGIVSRFVKARDAFHYDNFGGEVERHLERAMEDAYGFLHGLPDDLRAALGGSNG